MTPARQPTIILVRPRAESSLFDVDERFGVLTEELAALFPNAYVVCVPFLYDATEQSLAVAQIRRLTQPRLVLSTLPPRAARWLFRELLCEDVSQHDSFCQVELFSVESLRSVIEVFLKTCTSMGETETSVDSSASPICIKETLSPRWFPIIDRQECVGCLECVNFCLFGVYTIDAQSRPVVESPDACRNGCPACSRVCPGGAIMFPLHADPAISGKLDAHTVARQIQEHDTARRAREMRTEYLDRATSLDTNKTTDELDRLIDETDRFQE
ncbi:MAG: ferredoxin family protein [Planctomycetia bacterium]|nr:ferredoxin family protein [Planctomycetia bacterium]